MQIRPVSLPFKGYVEVNCHQGNHVTPITLNTKNIAFSPSSVQPKTTKVYNGNQVFIVDADYDTFQRTCSKADKSGNIERIKDVSNLSENEE